MYSIFADCSGDINNRDDRVVVYAALIADTQLINKQFKQQEALKDFLNTKGVTINDDFEINTHDVIKSSGIWRHVLPNIIEKTLLRLKNIIIELKIPYIILLINKDEGAVSILKSMQEFSKPFIGEYQDTIKNIMKHEAPEIDIEKLKAEKLTSVLGILFGLCNGLMVKLKMTEKASVIVDKQFFRQTDLWKGAFILTRASWEPMVKAGVFYTWGKEDKLEWYISDKVKDIDSKECFSVQLADYLAYTARTLKVHDLHYYRRFCPMKYDRLIQIHSGIYVGVSY